MNSLIHWPAMVACVVVLIACSCRVDQMRSDRDRWSWFCVYALITLLQLLRGQPADWNDAAGIGGILLLVIVTWRQWVHGPPPETTRDLVSYKDPWKRGQRCIIPAASFDEPNWESGKNQWWTFRRADGDLWGLAGLWNVWVDKATGEVHERYTMLTINADEHPLMNRMHKPDPKLAPDKQDKRSVIPIEAGDFDQWLEGTVDQARELMKLAPVEVFDAGPT